MAEVIGADVARQVDVASLSGEIVRAKANVAVLPRYAGRPVLTGVRVAQVDLGVAGVPSLHSSKSDRTSAGVVLDGVHGSEHERFRLEGPLLVAELENRAALFEVEARLADADVVVEGQELKEKQFLEEIFVQEDALLDVGGVEVVLVVSSGHRRGEGDV